MIKIVLILGFISTAAFAYVPTVESLFRNGANPDITVNGVSLTLSVRKIQPGETTPTLPEEFYKIFFTKSQGDTLKVSQSRYSDSTFSENSLVHKVHYNQFGAYTIKSTQDQVGKGLFFALLHSFTLNNGSHLVNYLKSLGVPVRLNSDLINRQKIEYLASYKTYLANINKDRNARKTEINPLRPEDPVAREKVEQVMNESMYVDTKQVKLGKDENDMAWLVKAGQFEASVSYKKREVQRLRYHSAEGELEITCSDFWLADGVHAVPRFMKYKSYNGELYQIEIKNLRQYVEKESDIARRLSHWEKILKSKESPDSRPEFLL